MNGVYNTAGDVNKSATELQKHLLKSFNAKVGFGHNKTGLFDSDALTNRSFGWVYDLLQVVVQQQTLMTDSTSRYLAQVTKQTLSGSSNGCNNKYVYWVAHSQGGAVIAAAWRRLDASEKARIRVITAAGANFYGFSGAKSYDAFYKSGDPVPYLLGSETIFNQITRHEIPGFVFCGHGFVDNYIYGSIGIKDVRQVGGIAQAINRFIGMDSK